jgi:hypothetical protein
MIDLFRFHQDNEMNDLNTSPTNPQWNQTQKSMHKVDSCHVSEFPIFLESDLCAERIFEWKSVLSSYLNCHPVSVE